MKQLLVLALVTIAANASADPSQWSSRNGTRYTQFAPPTNDGSEVRVYRAEAATDHDAWVRTRRGRSPEGVTLTAAYQAVSSPQPSVEIAFGRGRRGTVNVMVLSVACTTSDQRMSYAEVISPDAVFQSDAEDGLRIAIRECTGPSSASEPAPAAPTRRAPSSPPPPAPKETKPAPDTAAAHAQIAGLAGDSYYQNNYDGTGGYIVVDVLLLKSGWSTRSLSTVLEPGGPEGDRARHPDRWSRWRRAKGGVQTCGKDCNLEKNWRALAYGHIEELKGKGFRFAGSYHSVGGGTIGDTTALSHGFVSFSADGRFSTSSASSVSVNHWSPSTGTTGIASGGGKSATNGGTYEVDGLVLTLKFDDGTVRYRTIQIWQGKSAPTAPTAVLIDGTMYNRM